MDRLRQLWNTCRDAVDGLKTLGVSAIFFALGVADYLDVVNVKPMLDYVIGPDRGAKVMVFLPIVFATLRFFTNGRPRWMRHRDEPVDECNQTTEH